MNSPKAPNFLLHHNDHAQRCGSPSVHMLPEASSSEHDFSGAIDRDIRASASFTDEERQVLSNMLWEGQDVDDVSDDGTNERGGTIAFDPIPLKSDNVITTSFKATSTDDLLGNALQMKDTKDMELLSEFLSVWSEMDSHKGAISFMGHSSVTDDAQHSWSEDRSGNWTPSKQSELVGSYCNSEERDVPLALKKQMESMEKIYTSQPDVLVHHDQSCERDDSNTFQLEQVQSTNKASSIVQALHQCQEETKKQKRMQYALSVLTNQNTRETRKLVQQTAHDASLKRNEIVFSSLLRDRDNLRIQNESCPDNEGDQKTCFRRFSVDAVVSRVCPPSHTNSNRLQKNQDNFVDRSSGKNQKESSSAPEGNYVGISGTFPQQLLDILSRPEAQKVISWLPDGKGFAIIDREVLVSDVLPRYYLREVKLASFVRKLNRWGFQRAKSEYKNAIVYRHKFFQRDCPDLCALIRIKECSGKRRFIPSTQSRCPPFPDKLSRAA